MALATTKFDPADYLDGPEAVATYLTEALDTGDIAFIADALGVVSRARGMTEIARRTGLSREALYRSLSPAGNPGLDTALQVIHALGFRLSVSPERRPTA
jgi:probable addiction module antidote protein